MVSWQSHAWFQLSFIVQQVWKQINPCVCLHSSCSYIRIRAFLMFFNSGESQFGDSPGMDAGDDEEGQHAAHV